MKRMPNGWTPEMDAMLLRVFPVSGADAVSKLVGRSYSSVQMRAHRLGLHMQRRGKRPGGTALSDRLAREIFDAGLCGLSLVEFMARHANDNELSVRTTVGRLAGEGKVFAVGFRAWRRWFSTAEAASQYESTVRPPTFQDRLRAERADRKAMRAQERAAREAQRALIDAARCKRTAWTEGELRYMHKHYPTEGAKYVAPVLGRSVTAVTAKAAELGLKCEVRVQLIGYVKKTPPPKPAPAPKPPRVISAVASAARPANAGRPGSALVHPSPPKPSAPRGPARSDGPVSYHPDFKFTRVPTPPAAFRTNTFSAY